MSTKHKNTFLDGDSTILESNLKFVKNEFEEELKSIFDPESSGNSNYSENANSRIIQPDPGLCIKAFNDTEKKKLFINICQTEYIPAPPEKSEDDLRLIINSNNVTTYKIPMSISDLRKVMDKSGNFATACDIAINSSFFAKIKISDLFRHFFITIVFEAIENKYEIQLNLDNWTILKNRQAMGGLIKHRIRDSIIKQTESAHKLLGGLPESAGIFGSMNNRAPKKLIEVIDGEDIGSAKKEIKSISNNENYVPNATKLSISQAGTRKPDYRLFKRVADDNSLTLVAEFHLPECLSSREIALDVGEDRLILEARKRGYYFDSFVDYSIDQEKTSSKFHVGRGILSVEMPVITN